MNSVEPIAGHIVPFSLVLTRVIGLFMTTPILANRSIPRRAKVLIAVMFSTAVYPGLAAVAQESPPADLFTLLPLLLSELAVGAAIGFIAGLPILAMDLGGFLMGYQMGLGMARVYNPEVDNDTDVLGQLMTYLVVAGFLGAGGLDALFLCVVQTFASVPAGSFALTHVPLETVTGVLTSGFEMAFRVALPLLSMIFLTMIALGIISKTIPQINVMTVGFTFKIIIGLLMIVACLGAVQQVGVEEVERVLRLVLDWSRGAG